ncbi:complement factor H-like isoform X2 [Paramormyrops kingsleyae]|uniref:complement factor H-like isoform X2 n=1 Tax=Paramormyrops kingsleyae TaxID=1676925 RepID=UPI003B979D61
MPFFISFSAFHLFFIVSLCIYFTGVAAQKGCPARKIPELQNAENRSDLKDQYIHAESVRFACNTGFVGFFRVTCRDGVWSKSGRCQAKQCGHPGDTLNGDFTLIVGDDFVFGSSVQYTCRKGYTMASRISHRTCLLSGWDNIVPFCEVVKCEPLNPSEQLDVSGNFEAPQYSDVVEFECNSPAEKLNGPRQIYCTDTGDWSGQIPTCQEITCTRPEIPNSIPDGKNNVYKKDDIIRFQCVENYNAVGSGIARCSRDGWTMSVRCEEFTCKVPDGQFLNFTSFHATEYKVGEKVNYVCLEKYKKREPFATCTLNNWRPQTMCEEIICKRIPNSYYARHIHAGWSPYNWPHRITYGQYNYYCNKGFKETQPTATCTAHGWAPENPCEEIPCIKPPNVIMPDGGNVVRRGKHRYSCVVGYRETSTEVECTENGLVRADLCEHKNRCRDLPAIANGRAEKNNKEYSHGDYVEVECDVGYSTKCISGSLKVPACTAQEGCDNTTATGKSNKDAGSDDCGVAKCVNGEWQLPQCIQIICKRIPNGYSARHIHAGWSPYNWPHHITYGQYNYDCNQGFKKTQPTATCTAHGWAPENPCEAKCDIPNLSNGYMVLTKDESAISYTCVERYKPKTEGWWDYITCTNGKWSDTPQCIANNSCRALPVVYNTTTHKNEYSVGAKVEIQCYLGKISKCIDVKLECTENCTRSNDERKGSMDEDGGTCEAECQTDYSATCRDGEWTFPPCSDKVKDSPCDMVQDGQLENEELKKSIAKQIK